MNSRALMIISAIYLGVAGLGMTFLPEEISHYLNAEINQTSILFLQVLGSLYLGFAMLNWMTKNNLIGGIYSRPLVIGNLAHFLISSLAFIKIIGQYSGDRFSIILGLTIIYCGLTIWFGLIFLTNPGKVAETK